MTSLKLSKLDPAKQVAPGSIITLVGKRNTGKTQCILNLMFELRNKIELCICMTPTRSSAQAFAKVMPRCLIFDELRLDVIERLMDIQSEIAAAKRRVRSVLLVLDDTSWEAKAFRTPSPILARLYRNGRHLRISVICVLQDCMDYHVGLRGQVDVLMCLREVSLQMRKRLHSSWFGLLSLAEFNAVMDTVTERYGVLCLLNTVPSNTPAEVLYWWRAKLSLPPFRVVSDVYYFLAQHPELAPKEDKRNQPRREGCIQVETCGGSTVVSA